MKARRGALGMIAMMAEKLVRRSAVTALWFFAALSGYAVASDPEVEVNLAIYPTASLEFLNTPLLYLSVPPPDSTAPSNGVKFKVTGNAWAILTAEPDDFIDVPTEGIMGKAILGLSEIGYKIDLRFPRLGITDSPIQTAALPGNSEGPTQPPLEVNLLLSGGQREGVIHMETDETWTEDGGLPLPGLHVGSITLTLTADN
jgi:hypothetical protein